MGPKKGQDAATEAAKAQARIAAGYPPTEPTRKPSDTDSDLVEPPSSKRPVTDDPRNSMDDSTSSAMQFMTGASKRSSDKCSIMLCASPALLSRIIRTFARLSI